jgi:hypothetical protein
MHIPQLADRVRALEDYFRFDSDLPAADRERVLLVTAREMEARDNWARHQRHPGGSRGLVRYHDRFHSGHLSVSGLAPPRSVDDAVDELADAGLPIDAMPVFSGCDSPVG